MPHGKESDAQASYSPLGIQASFHENGFKLLFYFNVFIFF